MNRFILPATGILLGIAPVLLIRGDEPKGSPEAVRASLAAGQEQLQKDLKDLQHRIESLSIRLEKSERVEDRDRVTVLKKAQSVLRNSGLEGRLHATATLLRETERPLAAEDLARAAQQQKTAAQELDSLVTLLGAEDREMDLVRTVRESSRQLEALQSATQKQQQACEAAAKVLGKDTALERQRAAAESLKKVFAPAPRGKIPEYLDVGGVKQNLREAYELETRAQASLQDDRSADAVAHQQKALQTLRDSQGKLTEQLEQARAEQVERLLSGLQTRCQRMFDMQTTVRNETVSIFQAQNESGDRTGVEEKAQQLADEEDKIALEAHRATRTVEEDGSTLALPEIFYQLRRDMIGVASRLRKGDIGAVTQAIQQDILDTLRETSEAIKKARKESGGGPSPEPAPPSWPLVRTALAARSAIDPVAEMKVIHGLLNRANQRMDSFSKALPEATADLEKIKDPEVRARAEMLLREKQEFEAWKKRLPEVADDGKLRTDRNLLDRERHDAHFRELTDALHRLRHQLEKSSRTDNRDLIEQLDEVLKFAGSLKPDENRVVQLLHFLRTQKAISQELDRRMKRRDMAADVYAAFYHNLDQDQTVRNQEEWHEVTIRTRDAQERLKKQLEQLKQLQ